MVYRSVLACRFCLPNKSDKTTLAGQVFYRHMIATQPLTSRRVFSYVQSDGSKWLVTWTDKHNPGTFCVYNKCSMIQEQLDRNTVKECFKPRQSMTKLFVWLNFFYWKKHDINKFRFILFNPSLPCIFCWSLINLHVILYTK